MKKLLFILVLIGPLVHAVDNIQFKSIDFETNVVEMHNFGDSAQSLDGWRFCTHDASVVRRYSSAGGLNGVSIAAGESLFVHWNNDAPAEANRINISTIGGGFATLSRDAYGLQIYINGSFGNGASIADHLQWSLNGADNSSADERSDEAEAGGVWTDQNLWISTSENSTRIDLIDISGARLHSPTDYMVRAPIALPFTEFLVSGATFDGGTLDLSWEDLSGFGVGTYTLQTSTDLTNWEGAGTSGTNSFQLTGIVNFPSFFRVVVE